MGGCRQPHLKLIINCGMAEEWIGRCIESVRKQTYKNWEALVTVDLLGDRTFERAVRSGGSDSRFSFVSNPTPLYSTANLIRAIRTSRAGDEDVIVQLDGDDWFYSNHALEVIARTYEEHGCWVTYGSWIPDFHAQLEPYELPKRQPGTSWPKQFGRWPAYDDGEQNFRQVRWLATQVKTWKKWLWDLTDDQDLRDRGGRYFRVAQDCAVMFPMLEMSGTEKARHIAKPLMVYNVLNRHSCVRTKRLEREENTSYLRGKVPYKQITESRINNMKRVREGDVVRLLIGPTERRDAEGQSLVRRLGIH